MKSVMEKTMVIPDIIRKKVKIAEYIVYEVGGIADYFAAPKSDEEIIASIHWSVENSIEYFVLGSGSNVLISDEGFRGLIIWTKKCCSQMFKVKNDLIEVGGSVQLHDLVLFAEKHSLKGIAHLAGIPGTVGGAIHMNAGAFTGEIGDVVQDIFLITQFGEKKIIRGVEAKFGYRQAPGIEKDLVTGCTIALEPGEMSELAEERMKILKKRAGKQPQDFPSCGSVFKRPPGDYAGRLIDLCGLRGEKRGGAEISNKHANFILNTGGATAGDIFELIKLIKNTVEETTGVSMETEVKLIGFGEIL